MLKIQKPFFQKIQINSSLFTFFAITVFYFFESAQMAYFNVLAPYFLSHGIYIQNQIAGLSAAYFYGDMVGLLPVGYILDRFPLRKILLWGIAASIISAFLLIISHNFYMAWLARFLCGFFGGTCSFIGGIRVLVKLFSHRFTFFMGLFLSAGMFAGLVCQYPLLVIVNHIGAQGAMIVMGVFGLFVGLINFLFLHPVSDTEKLPMHKSNQYSSRHSLIQNFFLIIKNLRNWLDCLMIVLLDMPSSIIGTLWGIVVLMSFYHFSDTTSALIIMSLFAGLTIGMPIWGRLADHYDNPAWIIILGSSASFLMMILMLVFIHSSALFIGCLFFGLGFFSSCQTLGFTWLTKNMRPELIGLNSAFNSIIFMGANGGFKQIAASLLTATPLLVGASSAGNLLILTAGAMLLTSIYACSRKFLFDYLTHNDKEVLKVVEPYE